MVLGDAAKSPARDSTLVSRPKARNDREELSTPANKDIPNRSNLSYNSFPLSADQYGYVSLTAHDNNSKHYQEYCPRIYSSHSKTPFVSGL